MRNNSNDKTLNRNYLRKWRFLLREYDLVKQKRHPNFCFVSDFYKAHEINRHTFLSITIACQ